MAVQSFLYMKMDTTATSTEIVSPLNAEGLAEKYGIDPKKFKP
jgi:hypothetical protein